MTIKTILFDMDSTLNTINEKAFSESYFRLLHSNYFSELDIEYFFLTLTEITKAVMISNTPRELTMKTFMKEMSKVYNRKPRELRKLFHTFYANEYNELAEFVKPAENAVETVEYCFQQDYEVVIATTPIFTEQAIMSRLKWSGMGDFTFKLVTHAENMHFSKPREEYYQEILKKIKRKTGNCIMVGNEFMGDVVGPSRIGLATFYCPDKQANDDIFVSPELKRFSKIKPTYTGSLADFLLLLKNDFEIDEI